MMPKKILLVDDSETILQMERMTLQQDRYEVVTARDGQEGVTKALELKPNLILALRELEWVDFDVFTAPAT